ncbi:MAG: CBS domain-containing protein [Firmicutes bacterium]|nr:CBS domain-containing protein [Bacillota bacterium]
MQTAKEIMTKPALSARETDTVKAVLELLAEKRISGVPVVDEDEKVLGVISDTDIIRYAHQISIVPLSNLSGWISPYAEISDLASMRKGFDLLHRTDVSQIMTKKVYTVHEDAPAKEVAELMNRHKINRVPVVDTDNKLKGIVTRSDMVQCMANL